MRGIWLVLGCFLYSCHSHRMRNGFRRMHSTSLESDLTRRIAGDALPSLKSFGMLLLAVTNPVGRLQFRRRYHATPTSVGATRALGQEHASIGISYPHLKIRHSGICMQLSNDDMDTLQKRMQELKSKDETANENKQNPDLGRDDINDLEEMSRPEASDTVDTQNPDLGRDGRNDLEEINRPEASDTVDTSGLKPKPASGFRFVKKQKPASVDFPNPVEAWNKLGAVGPDIPEDKEWSDELAALVLRQMVMAFDNLPPNEVAGLLDALVKAASKGEKEAEKSLIKLGRLSRQMEALEAVPRAQRQSVYFVDEVRTLFSQIRMWGKDGERWQEGSWLNYLNNLKDGL